MPFTVTRRTAERRAARRRPRGLAEIQAAQTQYQQDVQSAQGRLTAEQTAAAREFSQLSQQYENQLRDYQSGLDAYNQRADDYSQRVDQYINTINQIEYARSENLRRQLMFGQSGGIAQLLDVPWVKYADIAQGHRVNGPAGNRYVQYTTYTGIGEAGGERQRSVPLSRYDASKFGGRTRRIAVDFETVPVPSTPADPGAFTEQFTRKVPTAPTAPSFTQDIRQFEQESEQARVRMEREVGERRAATMRARRRMTDRPLLSGE